MKFKKTISKRFRWIARDFIMPALSTAGVSIVDWIGNVYIPSLGLPDPLTAGMVTAVSTLGYKFLKETDYGQGDYPQ